MTRHDTLTMNRRTAALGLALAGAAPSLWAQQADPVKIGVLLPITGPLS